MAQIRWHAEGYSHRAVITVPVASTTADSLIWDPAEWFDDFWDVVQSTGYDVRFFDYQGNSLAFERATWTHASRAASFEVAYADLLGLTTVTEIVWVYWGNASATDASVATPTVSSVTATMRVARPERAILAQPLPAGGTQPVARVSMTTRESVFVWFDITDALSESGRSSYGSSMAAYQLAHVWWDATAGTGAYIGGVRDPATAPDVTQSATSVVEADGRLYVGLYLTGGTDGVDSVLSLLVALAPLDPITLWQVPLFEFSALVQVRNPDEA